MVASTFTEITSTIRTTSLIGYATVLLGSYMIFLGTNNIKIF